MEENMVSVEVGGDHYEKQKIQAIEYIHANDLDFDEGNVVKYISRHKDKNGAEDLAKCIHYTLFEMEKEYGLPKEVTANIMEIVNFRIKELPNVKNQ